MKKKLYIIGAGSVGGHVVYNFQDYCPSYEPAGFFDDDEKKIGTEQFGLKVIGPVDDVLSLKDAAVVVGIAFPRIKKRIVQKLKQNQSLKFPSLIHPAAWVSGGTSVGEGCVIYPGTSINYGSKIGDFVVMNMNCALGHHTKVGDYTSLAPGVNTGGHTTIEEAVDMGIGSSTIQDVKIGPDSVVGGQSMVIEDIDGGVTVAGVPAKKIKDLQ